MKKTFILTLAAVAVMVSCGDKNAAKPLDDNTPKKVDATDSLLGDWITYGDEASDEVSDTMGVTFKSGGKAQSINMPTYQYEEWKYKKDTVVITGVSKAEGFPDEQINDTGIVDLKTNTITLLGGDIVYKKK